jgi:hypothetical protein
VRRLAHGWTLKFDPGISEALAIEFIRLAVRAVPSMMACQLGRCQYRSSRNWAREGWPRNGRRQGIGLRSRLPPGPKSAPTISMTSRWSCFLCLGQALWIKLNHSQRKSYWLLLDAEIGAGVAGEIDEVASKQKRLLLAGSYSASSRRRLDLYGAASFAGTAADYVHCLWHDAVVRSGRDFLPAPQLKRRLDLLSAWFPPARSHLLFPQTPCQPDVGWISFSSRSSP